jgi:hypothetical protein
MATRLVVKDAAKVVPVRKDVRLAWQVGAACRAGQTGVGPRARCAREGAHAVASKARHRCCPLLRGGQLAARPLPAHSFADLHATLLIHPRRTQPHFYPALPLPVAPPPPPQAPNPPQPPTHPEKLPQPTPPPKHTTKQETVAPTAHPPESTR